MAQAQDLVSADRDLSVENLNVYYGESHIIRGVDLCLGKGEIMALLGRNGVGKTTFLKSIIGLLPAKSGRIVFQGEQINGKKPHLIARQGIAYVPQGREIFSDLTVEENLKVGSMSSNGVIPGVIFDYFPILRERLKQKGGTLSGGQQQMLALGRALAGKPILILLDEPTEGIQPSIIDDIARIIRSINEDMQVSILLIEQNIEFAFQLAHKCCIMEKGAIVFQGTVNSMHDEVIRRHLAVC